MTAELRRMGTVAYAATAAAIIAAAIAWRAPALEVGFTVDDYAQLAMMRGVYPVKRAPLRLFTFSDGSPAENRALRSTGFFPWWSNARLRISMFRPLASALMWLDLTLFGDRPLLYHLHSALWWAAMAATLAVLLRRVLPDLPALVALALFCADEAHAMLLGWIANRNAMVSTTFSVLGLLALLPGAHARDRRRLGVATCWFALALCAGESAVAFFGYAALFLVRSSGGAREGLRSLAPLLGLLTLYVGVRLALGFGAHGSGMYLDPIGETAAFAAEAVHRFPALAGDLVLAVRSNFWTAGSPFTVALVERGLLAQDALFDLRQLRPTLEAIGLAGSALFALLGWLALRDRGRQAGRPDLGWLVLGTPLALVPSLSSLPESRLLVPALLGFCVLVASLLDRALAGVHHEPRRASRVAAAVAASGFTLFHLALPSYYARDEARVGAAFAPAVRRAILAPELDALLEPEARVLLLSAADPTTTIYIPLVRRLAGRRGPRSCQLLAGTFVPLRLTTLSARSFELARVSDAYTPGDAYAAAFNREPLHDGQRFESEGLRVTVASAPAGLPLVVRYDLDRDLRDPSVVLLAQTPSGLQRIFFPAEGQSFVLPPPLPPFQLVAP